MRQLLSLISNLAFFAPRSVSHCSERIGSFACLLAGLYLAYNSLVRPLKI